MIDSVCQWILATRTLKEGKHEHFILHVGLRIHFLSRFVTMNIWLTLSLLPFVSSYSTVPANNDQKLHQRRGFLATAGVAAVGTAFVRPSSTMTLSQAMEWIEDNVDRRFFHSMVASDYQFLYRGVDQSNIHILQPTPDLLDANTYQDRDALSYFRKLEESMKNLSVKPSNGHLATTSPSVARQWSKNVASIWPSSPTHCAWYTTGGLFEGRQDEKNLIVDGVECGREGLEDALRLSDTEIMITCREFLSVPASMDNALRQELQKSFIM